MIVQIDNIVGEVNGVTDPEEVVRIVAAAQTEVFTRLGATPESFTTTQTLLNTERFGNPPVPVPIGTP